MKISKETLRKIIKEEVARTLSEQGLPPVPGTEEDEETDDEFLARRDAENIAARKKAVAAIPPGFEDLQAAQQAIRDARHIVHKAAKQVGIKDPTKVSWPLKGRPPAHWKSIIKGVVNNEPAVAILKIARANPDYAELMKGPLAQGVEALKRSQPQFRQ